MRRLFSYIKNSLHDIQHNTFYVNHELISTIPPGQHILVMFAHFC